MTNDGVIIYSGTYGSAIFGIAIYGDSNELPKGLTLRTNSFSTKNQTFDLAAADGAYVVGSQIKSRQVSISGTVISESRSAHSALMDLTRIQCLKAERISLGDGSHLRVLGLTRFSQTPVRLTDRAVSEVDIQFECQPFWFSDLDNTVSLSVYGNTNFGIDASGKQNIRGLSPVIVLTAPASGSIPTMTMTNVTDQSLQFRYSDPNFKNGAVVTIDCRQGTVTRDGTNTIRYFAGEFLRLVTDVNSISYTGNACTMSFLWTHSWL